MVFAPKETTSSIGWTPKQSSKKRKLTVKPNEENNDTASEEETQEQSSEINVIHDIGPTLPQEMKMFDSSTVQNMLPSGISQDLCSEVTTRLTFTKRSSTSSNSTVPSISIVGRAQITCLQGQVNILGYSLHPNSVPSSIYVDSPNWMSALSLEPFYCSTDDETVVVEITSVHHKEGNASALTYEIFHPQRVRSIFITERWNKIASDIIHDIHSQKHDSTLEHPMDLPCNNRILVCGAKGVGKSTYVRYITNRLLCASDITVKEVAILDCDVGQTELSPPGMLTLTIVTTPILSPAHAHMVCGANHTQKDHYQVADRHEGACFYGFTTSKINPESFTAAVSHLMDKYTNLCNERGYKVPLVVNTDGWVKGLGFEILSCVIHTVNCGHIVQLIGSTKAKFFDLSSHASSHCHVYLAETSSGSTLASCNPTPSISRNTSVASLQSFEGEAIAFKDQALAENLPHVSSSLMRNLRFCCYFLGGFENLLSCGASFQQSGIVDDEYGIANTIASMRPYMVPFDSLECHVMDEDGIVSQIMSSDEDAIFDDFNSAIVGLCGTSTSECFGLGLVRGIDRENKVFYILTPLDQTTLGDNVKSIVRGQLQIPFECVFRGEHSEAFPFLCCEGVSIGIGNDGTTKKKSNN